MDILNEIVKRMPKLQEGGYVKKDDELNKDELNKEELSELNEDEDEAEEEEELR
jgi:hypothetical protein